MLCVVGCFYAFMLLCFYAFAFMYLSARNCVQSSFFVCICYLFLLLLFCWLLFVVCFSWKFLKLSCFLIGACNESTLNRGYSSYSFFVSLSWERYFTPFYVVVCCVLRYPSSVPPPAGENISTFGCPSWNHTPNTHLQLGHMRWLVMWVVAYACVWGRVHVRVQPCTCVCAGV